MIRNRGSRSPLQVPSPRSSGSPDTPRSPPGSHQLPQVIPGEATPPGYRQLIPTIANGSRLRCLQLAHHDEFAARKLLRVTFRR